MHTIVEKTKSPSWKIGTKRKKTTLQEGGGGKGRSEKRKAEKLLPQLQSKGKGDSWCRE